jgi:hypothetical protein
VNGQRPVVMIFTREINDPLTSLVKKVDEINKEKGRKMGSFVVMLSDDEDMQKTLKHFAEKEKLEKTALTLDNPSGPPDYGINKKADVTVVLYVHKKVKVNRAYKKGEFKMENVEEILKDLPKILDAE